MWAGEHQTVRGLLQAVHDVLYPEQLATRRTSRSLNHALFALLGVNELFYLFRAPGSERARSILNLVPGAEARALRIPQMNRSKQWRQAVERILGRQRQIIRGGGSYDPEKKVATMYQQATRTVRRRMEERGPGHEWV